LRIQFLRKFIFIKNIFFSCFFFKNFMVTIHARYGRNPQLNLKKWFLVVATAISGGISVAGMPGCVTCTTNHHWKKATPTSSTAMGATLGSARVVACHQRGQPMLVVALALLLQQEEEVVDFMILHLQSF
jgi:hypothetical protein